MLINNTTNLVFILVSLFLSFFAIKEYINYSKQGNIKCKKTLYWGMGFVALTLAFLMKILNRIYPIFSIQRVIIYENLLLGISTWLHTYTIMTIGCQYKKFKKTKLHIIYWLILIVIIPAMTVLPTNRIYASLMNVGMISIILYTLHNITFKHPLFTGFLLMAKAHIIYIIKSLINIEGVFYEIHLGLMTVAILTIGISSYLIIKNRRILNDQ